MTSAIKCGLLMTTLHSKAKSQVLVYLSIPTVGIFDILSLTKRKLIAYRKMNVSAR